MYWDLIYHHLTAWSWRQVPGYLGALFVIASFVVRTMIPLRALSAASNLCFIVVRVVSTPSIRCCSCTRRCCR